MCGRGAERPAPVALLSPIGLLPRQMRSIVMAGVPSISFKLRRRGRFLGAALAVSFAASSSSAADPPAKPSPPSVTSKAAAVVPGVVVHGAGHYVRGDHRTAMRLFALETAGLLSLGGGFIGLFASGGSQKLAAPFALLAVSGAGLFAASWFGDLYGVSADRPTGEPQAELPTVESSLGYRYVYDPSMAYRSFVVTSLDARIGALRLRPEGWFGLGHANERLRLGAAFRFTGPRAHAARAIDGSSVDVEVAGVRHAYPSERFSISSLELAVLARLDGGRIAPSLRGTFADGSAGLAFARHDYRVAGSPTDATTMLLARVGFGAYLGRPSSGRPFGEASIFYDHRHDGYAGGFKMTGLGSGVAGAFGAKGVVYLTSDVGLLADVAVGAAWVGGLSILVREPVTPRTGGGS